MVLQSTLKPSADSGRDMLTLSTVPATGINGSLMQDYSLKSILFHYFIPLHILGWCLKSAQPTTVSIPSFAFVFVFPLQTSNDIIARDGRKRTPSSFSDGHCGICTYIFVLKNVIYVKDKCQGSLQI